jgi:hypothetical protein
VIGDQTDAQAIIHVRRADSSNHVHVWARQGNGAVRVGIREDGANTVPTAGQDVYVGFSANTTYHFRIVADGNVVTVYVDGVLTHTVPVSSLQGVSNTKVGLFSAGSGTVPVEFDNFEVLDIAQELPQEVSTDKATYAAGDSILCAISPEAIGVLPDTATLDGVAVTLGSPTTTSCTITVPDFADILPGESHEAVRLGVPVPLVITMDDASTVSATVTIQPSADVNTPNEAYWTGTVSDTQAGNGALANFAEGDGYLFVVEQGAITGITDEGVITYDTYYGGKMYRFEA